MPKKKKRWQLAMWLLRKREKKRSKKKRGNVTAQGRGRKKKQLEENIGIFVNQEKIHPHLVFSPFWRENILMGPGRKHLDPTIYFPSSLLTKHTSKKFSFLFSLQSFPSTLFHLQTNTPSKKGIGPRVVHRLALMDRREWWVLINCVCHVDGLDYYYKKNTSSLFWLCIN